MYYHLKEGDIIKFGDEFQTYGNSWQRIHRTDHTVGQKYHSGIYRPIRRKCKTLKEKIIKAF